MLISSSVDLNELFSLGKEYPWPRPGLCPVCAGQRLWSHGYVSRNFDGFDKVLWVKRYRCPDCLSVHTCRPAGYMPFAQASVFVVFLSIVFRICTGAWWTDLCRIRQRHWLHTFRRASCRFRNIDFDSLSEILIALLKHLGLFEKMLPFWLVYFLTHYVYQALHLPFPVTDSGPAP